MSRKVWTLVAVALTIGLIGSPAMAEDVMEQAGHCSINWSQKVVVCVGKGSPNLKRSKNVSQARIMAEQAAKADALRNILESLKGVKVSANVTVGQAMDADQRVRTEIQGVVRNFQVIATRYYSDGGVEVDVRMPLDGKLTKTVLNKDLKKAKNTDPTGVIVMAKGKKIVPVLAPRILDDKGNVVYGVTMVSETGAANGIVAYHKSEKEARGDQRVSDNPVVVKALEIKDSVDVVISAADAKKIRDLDSKYKIFHYGKVVFVKD
jgi:hypothetical protein